MCMCVYTGVCERSTPPDKKTGWTISLESIKSGAGEELLLLSCRAKAHVKGMCCSQTTVSRHAADRSGG